VTNFVRGVARGSGEGNKKGGRRALKNMQLGVGRREPRSTEIFYDPATGGGKRTAGNPLIDSWIRIREEKKLG